MSNVPVTPSTEAGRWFLEWDHNGLPLTDAEFLRRILAIEREAAAAAEERGRQLDKTLRDLIAAVRSAAELVGDIGIASELFVACDDAEDQTK